MSVEVSDSTALQKLQSEIIKVAEDTKSFKGLTSRPGVSSGGWEVEFWCDSVSGIDTLDSLGRRGAIAGYEDNRFTATCIIVQEISQSPPRLPAVRDTVVRLEVRGRFEIDWATLSIKHPVVDFERARIDSTQ